MFSRHVLRTAAKPLTPTVTPKLPFISPRIRTMASGTGQKCEWLVVLPDHEGMLAKRMEVRP